MTFDRRTLPNPTPFEPVPDSFVRYDIDSHPDYNGDRRGLHLIGRVRKTHRPRPDFALNVCVEYPTLDSDSLTTLWSFAWQLLPATSDQYHARPERNPNFNPTVGEIVRHLDSDTKPNLQPIGLVQDTYAREYGDVRITLPAKYGGYRNSLVVERAAIRPATPQERTEMLRELIGSLDLR